MDIANRSDRRGVLNRARSAGPECSKLLAASSSPSLHMSTCPVHSLLWSVWALSFAEIGVSFRRFLRSKFESMSTSEVDWGGDDDASGVPAAYRRSPSLWPLEVGIISWAVSSGLMRVGCRTSVGRARPYINFSALLGIVNTYTV